MYLPVLAAQLHFLACLLQNLERLRVMLCSFTLNKKDYDHKHSSLIPDQLPFLIRDSPVISKNGKRFSNEKKNPVTFTFLKALILNFPSAEESDYFF